MNIYEITGNKDSKSVGSVFGQFTTGELAEEGRAILGKELAEETSVRKSDLALNTVKVNGAVMDLTAKKSADEIIAARDGDNFVEGYVTVHISTLLDNDFESFLDIISEELVGNDLLMDINYDVVALAEDNTLVLKVSGDVSNIIDESDDDDTDET